MKKKLLAAAIAATLGQGVAQAANLNPDGLGQVLIYPYFTVAGQHTTLVSVTNTTDRVKAVKVRFLEGKNSQEVLDFNMYLSPMDMWVGQIAEDAGGGAKLVVPGSETTCTVPAIPSSGEVAFKDSLLNEGGVAPDITRTRQGHIEIIEMGNLPVGSALAAAATHAPNGPPADCSALTNAWQGSGTFVNNPQGIDAPTGGLYGLAHIVNVVEGKDYSYDAVAIDGFRDRALHGFPGDTQPSLASASPSESYVFDGTTVAHTIWPGGFGGIDAISSLFMHKAAMNDYSRDTETTARTDWVITFPTKKFYVNSTPARRPFTETFAFRDAPALSGACENVMYTVYDREENELQNVDGLQFSPSTPADGAQLCWESNVVSIDGDSVLGAGAGDVLGELGSVPFQNGWVKVAFNSDPRHSMTGLNGTVRGSVAVGDNVDFFGLPTVGFAVQLHKNLNADAGKKAEYGALFNNKNMGPFSGS